MFKLKVNDSFYDGFVSANFTDVVDNICNKFDLTCAVDEDNDFPVKRGDFVELFISDTKVLTGYIEVLNVNAPQDNFTVNVSGRDSTKAILKSDLSPGFNIKGPIDLVKAMKKCLKNASLTFEIINEAGDIKEFTKKEIVSADVGGNIFELWKKLSEKRQLIISKDRDANVVIKRDGDKKYNKKLLRLKDDPSNNNNVVASSGSNSDANRKKYHYVVGQENVAVKRDEAPPTGNDLYNPEIPGLVDEQQNIDDEELAVLNEALRNSTPGSELERAIDEQIAALFAANKIKKSQGSGLIKYNSTREQRTGVAVDSLSVDGVYWEKTKTPSSQSDCEDIAQRKLNQSRVDSITYNCEVVDFEADDNEPWQAGYLVDVVDEFCDVRSEMKIVSVSYDSSSEGDEGDPRETCSLSLTIPDAYSTSGNASDTNKQISVFGDKFNRDETLV